MRAILVLVGSDSDFLDHGAQQFFLVAWRGGGRSPSHKQIVPEGEHTSAFIDAEGSGPQSFTVCEFGHGFVEFAQAVLPFSFETAGGEAVVGVDCTIPALGTLSLVVCPLHREAPLRKRAIVIGFEPLDSGERSLDTEWLEGRKHRAFNRLVDLYCADSETVDATTVCDGLTGAMVAWGCGAADVVRAHLAAAPPAHGEALQQCCSFSHGATACLMRARMRVGGDACAISLEGAPIDEAFVVVR